MRRTQTEDVYLTIRRIKQQKQATGIYHNLLVKMIETRPDTLTDTSNQALFSLGFDFLAQRSGLAAIRNDDITLTLDGSIKGIIRKRKSTLRKGQLIFRSERSVKLFRK